MSAFEIGMGKQDLHVGALRILSEHRADLRNGLRIQLALHIDAGKRTARHSDFGRFNPIPASIQPLQFTLNGGIRRLDLKRAFHVPDGVIKFVLFIADDAQTDMRHKIIRHRHQQATEDIHGFAIAPGFKVGFA